jgi:hypothetical protein
MGSSSGVDSSFMDLFIQYRWYELWQKIEHIDHSSNSDLYALYTFLNISLWYDDDRAKGLVNNLSDRVIDTKECLFFTLLTYIYLADTDIINTLKRNNLYSQLPKWMKLWIEIEYLGRALKEKDQYKIVNKELNNNSRHIHHTIKIALYQSLNHSYSKRKYLCKLISKNKTIFSNDNIDILLSALCDFTLYKSTKVENPFQRYLYINKNISTTNPIQTTHEYQKLFQENFISSKILQKYFEIVVSTPIHNRSLDYINSILKIVPDSIRFTCGFMIYEIIYLYMTLDLNRLFKLYTKYANFSIAKENLINKNNKIYFLYIYDLCKFWQHNKSLYVYQPNYRDVSILHVIGESHSLSSSNIYFKSNNIYFKATTSFIMGIKMYHLSINSIHKQLFLLHLNNLKIASHLLFTVGEIDTRPKEGIWKVYTKKGKNLDDIINETVNGYIDFLKLNLDLKKPTSITIQGIPAPNYELKGDMDPGKNKKGFLNMIKEVNHRLKDLTLKQGWYFLDVYSATVNKHGRSNKKYHLDDVHLKPSFYLETNRWLIHPKIKEEENLLSTIGSSKNYPFST